MRVIVFTAALLFLASVGESSLASDFHDVGQSVEEQVKAMRHMVGGFGQQMMMLHHLMEERVRASGKSGVKDVRVRRTGTKSFHSESHAGGSSIAIHDHSNNKRTAGMGEFSAVLNGVEFRTRHNDYKLVQPSKKDQGYNKVDDIEFPPVPPSVLKKATVKEQIEEMAEYFRAWRDQDKKHRDYTKYFKPVLCYLEGAWLNASKTKFADPFPSDRHRLAANSWHDLLQKVRFAAYSGTRSRGENLAFLPTSVLTAEGGLPQMAQFHYRILCHPVAREVPLRALRVVDDFSLRMRDGRNILQHERSRLARFQFGPSDAEYVDGAFTRGLLDDIMDEIPGKNNYPGYLNDPGLDIPVCNADGKTPKNAARYHRMYHNCKSHRDASGVWTAFRGWNDDQMFAALTTHEEVAELTVENRHVYVPGKGHVHTPLKQRWTWAMPLELIYLTPLQSWNPYNLEYRGEAGTPAGNKATDGGRWGSCHHANKEYNGVNSRAYYMTPAEFFGNWHSLDAADTTRGLICVRDRAGKVQKVQASGVRTFTPQIGDVGAVRTRYPVFRLHDEGSTTWKELEALRDLVMDKDAQRRLAGQPGYGPWADGRYQLRHQHWHREPFHSHELQLTVSQQRSLMAGAQLTVDTEDKAHSLQLRYMLATSQLHACTKVKINGGMHNRCWYVDTLKVLAPASSTV